MAARDRPFRGPHKHNEGGGGGGACQSSPVRDGTDYLFRAYVTLIGLDTNLSEDAVYPAAFNDSAGEPLNGANWYVAHFDALPPVKGFLVANLLNRYAIRGNDPVQMSPGGALDLYLQTDSPGADKASNWLPTGSDQFSVYLRMYWPQEAVLTQSWKLPTITKVKLTQRCGASPCAWSAFSAAASAPPGISPKRTRAPACPGCTAVTNKSLSPCRCTESAFDGTDNNPNNDHSHHEGDCLCNQSYCLCDE